MRKSFSPNDQTNRAPGAEDSPLSSAPLPGLIFSLALPAMFSQIISLAYNVIDRIYLGHTEEGALAITAAGVCVPAITIIFAFINLFARGGAPLASISLGAGGRERAERLLGVSLFWLLALSMASTAAILLFAEPILTIFAAQGAVLENAALYLRIYSLGNIFMMCGLGLNFFINAQGRTKTAMFTLLIGCGANIMLDPLFIFALGMGMAGAAVATVISQFLSLLWAFHFFQSSACAIRIRGKFIVPCPELALKIIVLGSAPAFMVGSEGILHLCFNLQMGRIGGDMAIGAMAILGSLFQLLLFPMIGIYQGAQPIVSYNYGAGNQARVKKAIFLTGIGLCLYSLISTFLMFSYPAFFTGLFTDDEQLAGYAARLLPTYICGGFFLGLMTMSQDSYNALGDGKLAFFFAFLRKGILLVPLIFILPEFIADKPLAVAAAESISDMTASICSALYFLVYLRGKFGRSASTEKTHGETQ